MLCDTNSVLAASAACSTLLSRSKSKSLLAQFERKHVASIISQSKDPADHTWSMDYLMLVVSLITGQRNDYTDQLLWSYRCRQWECTKLW